MRVSVNGEPRDAPDGLDLRALLAALGLHPDEPGLAAALDGAVVPRPRWPATPVPPGARIEVVRPAAGG